MLKRASNSNSMNSAFSFFSALSILLISLSISTHASCVNPPASNYCIIEKTSLNNFNQTSASCPSVNSDPLHYNLGVFPNTPSNCSEVLLSSSASCQLAYTTFACSYGCNPCALRHICPSVCTSLTSSCPELNNIGCLRPFLSYCSSDTCIEVAADPSHFSSASSGSALGVHSLVGLIPFVLILGFFFN